jgi:hypothetical protein
MTASRSFPMNKLNAIDKGGRRAIDPETAKPSGQADSGRQGRSP